jgi:hypothetical protein
MVIHGKENIHICVYFLASIKKCKLIYIFLLLYYKFGFRYVKNSDHTKVKNNKHKLDQLKTSDLNIDKFIFIIIKQIINNQLKEIRTFQDILYMRKRI